VLRWIAVALLVATLASVSFSDTQPACSADDWLAGFDLEHKIAQLLIVRFDGPALAPDLAAMIRRHHVGGVAVYAKAGNIVDGAQVQRLTSAMQDLSAVPLAVVVDQEGGRVDRLEAVRGKRPSAESIAARGDPARARAAGREDAADLARLGIAVNLAPVVDVTRVYNWQLSERTFGGDAATVARFARAYLDGLQASGRVIGVLKHFPGLGSVAEDPHQMLPRTTVTREELETIDWAPYRTLLAGGGVHAIMVSHVIVDALDPTLPGSLAPAVVTGGVRDALGFDGVVVVDSLGMKGAAVSERTSIGDRALAAWLAGNDWLLGAKSARDVADIVTRATRAVASGELGVDRLDRSLRRVLALKERVGLLPRAGCGA
jgi:beta-N-acetylhexosaminidase